MVTCIASHTVPHTVPSVYSPDNCCCRRIPLRAHTPPTCPYDPGRMLVACPLIPRVPKMDSGIHVVGLSLECITEKNLSKAKVIGTARKCTDFVSWSTITHIVSCFYCVRGKWVTKSIVTCSHFHLATSNG